MKYLFSIILILFLGTNVQAKLHTETIEYKEGYTVLDGYLAYDDAIKGKRPGVMVVHEWTGLGPYVKRRANELAELGYIAFAADIYGKGVRPKDHEEYIF
jgi:dienelactone hydrolase